MASSVVSLFTSFISGQRLIDGGDLANMVNLLFGYANGIVAHAGGGQTNATPLAGTAGVPVAFASVETVASAADSVLLPAAIPGLEISVANKTATSMQVFGVVSNGNNGGVGDTISASGSNTQVATNTGVAHAGATVFVYSCFKAGQWTQH